MHEVNKAEDQATMSNMKKLLYGGLILMGSLIALSIILGETVLN